MMMFIVIAGVISLWQMRKETIPTVNQDSISISVAYPGASPVEIEKAICQKIEESIYDLNGIRNIISTANENTGTVMVEVTQGFSVQTLLNDIKTRIDSITTLPREAERPVVTENVWMPPAMHLLISGPADDVTLQKLAEKVRDEVVALPEITQAKLSNFKEYEIGIELNNSTLQSYGLSFAEVADAVRNASLDMAGGSIKTDAGEVLLRAQGQVYEGDQIKSLTLRAAEDGNKVTVGDVATVVDGLEETDLKGSYNGKPATLLTIYRVGNQSVLQISKQVRQYIAKTQPLLPDGVTLAVWQDRSIMFKSRLDLLLRNAAVGLGLVFIILLVFLRLRLAWWVSVGIAIAFMGAFWVLPYMDGSLNMISMFAFILVLGIVVDDAIIVGENIFTQHRLGLNREEAAIFGAQDVAKPVIFAVFTTIVAFAPIMLLPGVQGKLWGVISVVVIATLLFSLIESLYILPAHLSGMDNDKKPRFAWTRRLTAFQEKQVTALEHFILKRYRPFLAMCLRWRYSTMAFFVAIALIFYAVVKGGWIPLSFFPNVEGDVISVSFRYAQGTHADITQKTIDRMENAAMLLKEELKTQYDSDEIRNVVTTLGAQPFSRGRSGAHVGELALEMVPAEQRKVANTIVKNRFRELIGELPQVLELKFNSEINHRGPPLAVELIGNDLEQLRNAAKDLTTQLQGYPGLYDVRDSLENGKPEIEISIKPHARHLGLDFNALARQVRQAFYGEEVQRILRDRNEVKIYVRFAENERGSVYFLENMSIRLPNGSEVPLSTVAELNHSRGPNQIKRVNRNRVMQVTAYIDTQKTTLDQVLSDLNNNFYPEFTQRYPDIKRGETGQQKDRRELLGAMLQGFVLAILGIYILLAIPFKSYLQPLIVLSAIPFGIIGAIIGHLLLGLDLSMLSLSGMIAVSGVVVNDNLVLVDYINRAKARGETIAKAIRTAGAARFRPIMLTSITTFAGLTPLMMEKSVQAQFLIPMAVALAFGVMFATTVSLVLIPAAYHILEDFQSGLQRVLRWLRQRLLPAANIPEESL